MITGCYPFVESYFSIIRNPFILANDLIQYIILFFVNRVPEMGDVLLLSSKDTAHIFIHSRFFLYFLGITINILGKIYLIRK